MSGIFGYIGKSDCKDILLDGISALHNRGCETTGIALKTENNIVAIKTKGNAESLKQGQNTNIDGTMGLAQTDIALRCFAANITAKPAANGKAAVCMDGDIKGFETLCRSYAAKFSAVTDEDLVVAILTSIESNDGTQLLNSLLTAIPQLPTTAFFINSENAIFCHRGDMPLLIGIGNGEHYISSQMNALSGKANKYIVLSEGDSAKITTDKVVIFDSKGKRVRRSMYGIPPYDYDEYCYLPAEDIGYSPFVIKDSLSHILHKDKFDFDYLRLTKRYLDKLNEIYVIGEGDSLAVALCAGHNIAALTDIPVVPMSSQELLCSGKYIDRRSLIICVSHRGEDRITLSAIKKCADEKARIIAITDDPYSQIARLSDDIICPQCKFSNDSISLRSFFADYIALCSLGIYIGKKCGIVSDTYYSVAIKMMELLPGKIMSAVNTVPNLLSKAFDNKESIIVTGFQQDYPLALESSRVLQALANIPVIAAETSVLDCNFTVFLQNCCTVIAIVTTNYQLNSALHCLLRARALNAKIIIYTTGNLQQEFADFETVITFNDSILPLNPLPCIAGLYATATELMQKNKNMPTTEITAQPA